MPLLNKHLQEFQQSMVDLLRSYLIWLADAPEQMLVVPTWDEQMLLTLTIECAEEDRGKLIGRHGHHIRALRVMFKAISLKRRKNIAIQVNDRYGNKLLLGDETEEF